MTVRMSSRDASCYNRPNVRSTKVYHVALGWPPLAACSGAPLYDLREVLLSVDETPERLRCRRLACMNRWKESA